MTSIIGMQFFNMQIKFKTEGKKIHKPSTPSGGQPCIYRSEVQAGQEKRGLGQASSPP